MNLEDPKFRGQVRKVTMIFGVAGITMSVAAFAISLYALSISREREAFEAILANPRAYPDETRMVDCFRGGEITLEPKIFCEYFDGEVRPSR